MFSKKLIAIVLLIVLFNGIFVAEESSPTVGLTGTLDRILYWTSEMLEVENETAKLPDVCSNGGETGANAFTKYGFDRLLWDWGWSESSAGDNGVAFDACDEKGGKYYCDESQFGIGVSKKLNAIEKFVNEYKSSDATNGTFFANAYTSNWGKAVCNNTAGLDCLQNLRTSSELYRFVKKQVVINVGSEENPKYAAFFLDEKNNVLENFEEKKELISALETEKNVVERITNPALIIDNTISIESSKTKNIIAEIPSNPKFDAALESIGAQKPSNTVPSYSKYILTFDKFAELNRQIRGGKSTLTPEFLHYLYDNISFKVGIRNVSNAGANIGIDDKLKEYIIENAGDAIDLSEKEYSVTSFNDFYHKYIFFNSFLKQGDFTSNFVKKFAGESSYNGKTDSFQNFEKILFNVLGSDGKLGMGEEKFKTFLGKHAVDINANWTNNFAGINFNENMTPAIKLTFEEKLQKNFEKNPFFFVSFNALLDKTGSDGESIPLNQYSGEVPLTYGGIVKSDIFDEKLQSGILLNLNRNGKMEYSPSIPYNVQIEWIAGAYASPFAGDGRIDRSYVYKLNKEDGTAITVPIKEWKVGKNGKDLGYSKDVGWSALTYACKTTESKILGSYLTNTGKLNSKEIDLSKNSDKPVVLTATWFIPKGEKYFLRILCAVNSAKLKVEEIQGISAVENKIQKNKKPAARDSSAEPISLNGELKSGEANGLSVSKIISLIIDGKVCIKSIENSIELKWK